MWLRPNTSRGPIVFSCEGLGLRIHSRIWEERWTYIENIYVANSAIDKREYIDQNDTTTVQVASSRNLNRVRGKL